LTHTVHSRYFATGIKVIKVKNEVYKDSHRRRGYTSKTAKVLHMATLIMCGYVSQCVCLCMRPSPLYTFTSPEWLD